MNSFAAAPAAPDTADARLEAVHLGDMTRLLSGRWRLLAGAGIAAFAASVLFVTLVPPRYTGEAKLILESRDRFYTRPTQDRGEQQPLIDEQAVASQGPGGHVARSRPRRHQAAGARRQRGVR